MSLYRSELEAALRLFARVSEAMARESWRSRCLSAAAAAQYYSCRALFTDDFALGRGRAIFDTRYP